MLIQIVHLVLASITSINWVILLILHCLHREFRNPPGSLIAGDIASSLLSAITVIYEIVKGTILQDFGYADWKARAILFSYSDALIFWYLFSLCLEIYKITQNPLDTKYDKRATIYHISNQIIAVILTIIALIFESTYSVDSTYWISDRAFMLGEWGVHSIFLIGSVVLIVLTIKTIKTHSRYLYRYIIFCLAFALIVASNFLSIFASE